MTDRLTEIKDGLAETKRGAVFPSCERADTDMRWLVAEVEQSRAALSLKENARRGLALSLEMAEAYLVAERIENTRLREAFVAMEKAANQREAERDAARVSLANKESATHRLRRAEADTLAFQRALVTTEEARNRWHQKYTVEAQARADETRFLGDSLTALRQRHAEETCATCLNRDDEPKQTRWRTYVGPFCRLAGRDERDDTPNDDDGEPILVRCETLGNRCGAWMASEAKKGLT
jgi:hypothetical protein